MGQAIFSVERADRELHQATRNFAQQSSGRSWWYIGSTFALLATSLAGAAFAPWWPMRLVASMLAALLLVRTFILYHDFMHGAILPGSKMARAVFYTYAAVNLTPPRSWRDSHNFHHANVGRIAESNVGAFPLMTANRVAQRADELSRDPPSDDDTGACALTSLRSAPDARLTVEEVSFPHTKLRADFGSLHSNNVAFRELSRVAIAFG